MKQIEEIRSRFAYIGTKVYGKPLIYFDNAATSQRPESVVEALCMWSRYANANVHRAVHKLSGDATDHYEAGREAVRSFINASAREEVIFTSGTTASINLIANTFGEENIMEGDQVLISEGEHHSNIVPWQLLCKKKGAELVYLPVDENGEWRMDLLPGLLGSGRVKIVSAAHISNVLGILNPVEELVAAAHARGIPVHIDGAQGVVHSCVDVQKIGCDFYSFSGHKIYAYTGIGVLYGRRELMETLPPWMGGGDMVDTVTYHDTRFAPLPLRFEAGTPNFLSAASLGPAIEFITSIRVPEIEENEKNIKFYLEDQLNKIDGLHIVGKSPAKVDLFSFRVEGAHHSDLAMLLDKMGIAVRSGLMCAEPLINKFGQSGLVRISPAPFNTMEECEYFISSLKKAVGMLRQ